jgi:hypothetical protein
MLTATPRHWFSWDYALATEHDHLADIDISCWREKGTLTIEGQQYAVYRERPMSGKFVLESGGAIVASAQKPSSLRRRLLIEHAGRHYELKPRDMFTRTYVLREGTAVVGTLSATGLFTRRMNVDLPETLPLPVRVFVVWLTVILWKRDAAASSA